MNRNISDLGAILAISAVLLASGCGKQVPEGPDHFANQTEKAWTPLVSGEAILERTRRLCALGPRVSGTPGIERARAELSLQFHEAGYPNLIRRSFTSKTPDPRSSPQEGDLSDRSFPNQTRFVNLIAELPGARREGIAIAAHYDSKLLEGFEFTGANDAASAVATVVTIAEKLAQEARSKPRERSLYFVLFDGEESIRHQWQSPDCTYGSRHLADELSRLGAQAPFPIKSLVLLDMIGAPKLWLGDDQKSDGRLRRLFRKTSREVFGLSLLDRAGQVNAIVDDHIPFMQRGIPAIDLIDGAFAAGGSRPTWWHTAEDTVDRLSARSLEKVATLVLHCIPQIEKDLR